MLYNASHYHSSDTRKFPLIWYILTYQKEFFLIVCFFILLSLPGFKMIPASIIGGLTHTQGEAGDWAGLRADARIDRGVQTPVRVSRKIALHARGLTLTLTTTGADNWGLT